MSPFLVVYRRSTGEVTVKQFPDAISAMEARLLQEASADDDLEVVVLGSDSGEKLRETHSRYFKDPSEILESSRRFLDENTSSQ